MQHSDISIIIVHWNTPEILRKQLQLLKTGRLLQIIVVDNNSSQPVDWITDEFPHIQVIQNKTNKGYSFACNQGALASKNEWLIFLNPDVEIRPSHMDQLIKFTEKNNLDACSPYTSEGYHKPLPTLLSLLVEFTPLNKYIPLSVFKEKSLFGGCLLIKRKSFMAIGGWDERFFLWFEDGDLTKRLIQLGYKTGWASIPLSHKGGASFDLLDTQLKRDIFFYSMEVYGYKYFNAFEKYIIGFIKRHYSKRKTLPILSEGVSITIPNMKEQLLTRFFEKNASVLPEISELIIVSSTLHSYSIWKWREQFPQVRFISIGKNRGFTQTVNIGLRAATTKWNGTVNDDVTISPDCITKCIEKTYEQVGSLNPIVYQSDGEIESGGIRILAKGKAIPNNKIPIKAKPFVTDATNGAAVLYRQEALNKVGIFDERLGSYLEDIELSLRLTRAGYLHMVIPTASIIHDKHATSAEVFGRKKRWYDFRNWIYIILIHWGIRKFVLNLSDILFERMRNLSGAIKN